MAIYKAVYKPCADGVVVICNITISRGPGFGPRARQEKEVVLMNTFVFSCSSFVVLSSAFRYPFRGTTSPWRAILGWAIATFFHGHLFLCSIVALWVRQCLAVATLLPISCKAVFYYQCGIRRRRRTRKAKSVVPINHGKNALRHECTDKTFHARGRPKCHKNKAIAFSRHCQIFKNICIVAN